VPFDAIDPQGTEVSDLGYNKPKGRGARQSSNAKRPNVQMTFDLQTPEFTLHASLSRAIFP
jgi:hypothetical protein